MAYSLQLFLHRFGLCFAFTDFSFLWNLRKPKSILGCCFYPCSSPTLLARFSIACGNGVLNGSSSLESFSKNHPLFCPVVRLHCFSLTWESIGLNYYMLVAKLKIFSYLWVFCIQQRSNWQWLFPHAWNRFEQGVAVPPCESSIFFTPRAQFMLSVVHFAHCAGARLMLFVIEAYAYLHP